MEQKTTGIKDLAVGSSTLKSKEKVLAQEPSKKPNMRYLRDKMREPVRGIFKFDEAPGQTLSFVYREFKEDPIEKYELVDGEIATIPLGVARHINKNMNYPIHSYLKDEAGDATMRIGRKVQRASFQSLEFVDIDDIGYEKAEIYTAEKV